MITLAGAGISKIGAWRGRTLRGELWCSKGTKKGRKTPALFVTYQEQTPVSALQTVGRGVFDGVGVLDGVGVSVGVLVGVRLGDGVFVDVGVLDGVTITVLDGVGVSVGVFVGTVGLGVNVFVAV